MTVIVKFRTITAAPIKLQFKIKITFLPFGK